MSIKFPKSLLLKDFTPESVFLSFGVNCQSNSNSNIIELKYNEVNDFKLLIDKIIDSKDQFKELRNYFNSNNKNTYLIKEKLIRTDVKSAIELIESFCDSSFNNTILESFLEWYFGNLIVTKYGGLHFSTNVIFPELEKEEETNGDLDLVVVSRTFQMIAFEVKSGTYYARDVIKLMNKSTRVFIDIPIFCGFFGQDGVKSFLKNDVIPKLSNNKYMFGIVSGLSLEELIIEGRDLPIYTIGNFIYFIDLSLDLDEQINSIFRIKQYGKYVQDKEMTWDGNGHIKRNYLGHINLNES